MDETRYEVREYEYKGYVLYKVTRITTFEDGTTNRTDGWVSQQEYRDSNAAHSGDDLNVDLFSKAEGQSESDVRGAVDEFERTGGATYQYLHVTFLERRIVRIRATFDNKYTKESWYPNGQARIDRYMTQRKEGILRRQGLTELKELWEQGGTEDELEWALRLFKKYEVQFLKGILL